MDGNWNNNSTWDDTHPGCSDTIVIPEGITVTITATEDLQACGPTLIFVFGRMEFQTGKKLKLPCNSAVIIEESGSMGVGGGGGSSTYLEICSEKVWTAAMGDVEGYILLPVELCCFNGIVNTSSGFAELSWNTLSELNNKGFWVEKSFDGMNWDRLSFINGYGTSVLRQNYRFVDSTDNRNVAYYRLTQVDMDGNTETFAPIVLRMGPLETEQELYVFPNPVQAEKITVYINNRGNQTVIAHMFDLNGKLVFSKEVLVENEEFCIIELPFDLQSGNYLLKIGDAVAKVIVID